ncbi:MAG TPA: hypothetical protein VHM25_07370 [Polyangiaceae bacterium]|jgi:hypothetical protein|nr:hypothetical protein [Polyangiaceae bacterium]
MRWFGVRLQLLLTALMVLLATAASDRSHYFCKMMGRAVDECCCSTEQHLQRGRSATVQSPDCCSRLAAGEQPAVITSHNATLPDFPSAALAATLPAFAAAESNFRVVPALRPPARAPPGVGPPLFLSHCALLI